MILDLNTLLFYADSGGLLRDSPQRRYMALVDAVVAGEGDGPLDPEPRAAGTFFAGFNPLAVDAAAAAVAGLDPLKIPMIARGFECAGPECDHPLASFGIDKVRMVSNWPGWDGATPVLPSGIPGRLGLRPAPGWEGILEAGETDDRS
jgi:hypothetical protein